MQSVSNHVAKEREREIGWEVSGHRHATLLPNTVHVDSNKSQHESPMSRRARFILISHRISHKQGRDFAKSSFEEFTPLSFHYSPQVFPLSELCNWKWRCGTFRCYGVAAFFGVDVLRAPDSRPFMDPIGRADAESPLTSPLNLPLQQLPRGNDDHTKGEKRISRQSRSTRPTDNDNGRAARDARRTEQNRRRSLVAVRVAAARFIARNVCRQRDVGSIGQ